MIGGRGLNRLHLEIAGGKIHPLGNVTGGSERPVAEALRNRHTPFVFITGYASPDLDPEMLHYAKRLLKPIDAMTLEKVLAEELGEV